MSATIIPLVRPDRKTLISVIMVSYMTGPALHEAIAAVLADPDIYELILVDNGNSEVARQKVGVYVNEHAKVRLLQGHGNIGFARGCNYGAQHAKGSHFLFLNPDAVIAAGSAIELAKCGDRLTVPWIAGGSLKDIHGHEQRGARRGTLTPMSAIVSFTPLHKLPYFKSIHRENETPPADAVPMPTLSGACMMTDRVSFERLGGFDEAYFLHVEDIDICRRARQAGGDVYYVPSAPVMHYGSTSYARRQTVEWTKLKGFIHYFWTYSKHPVSKALTLVMVPFMTAAIMGRAWWLAIRFAFLGR